MMRIYQVLVIGSFVALAACTDEDRAASDAAPVAESAPANDAYPAQADDSAATNLNEGSGRPEGATDPLIPPPQP